MSNEQPSTRDQSPARTHQFLVPSSSPPDRTLVRELALQLANYYAKLDKSPSRNQWTKLPKAVCRWQLCDKDGTPEARIIATEQVSLPFHVEDFIRDLTSNRAFDHRKYSLPEPKSPWLDSSISMSPNFYTVASDTSKPITFRFHTNLGPAFPMAPTIDREGAVYTSFQGVLINGLSRLFDRVAQASTLSSHELWLYEFRGMVTEAVSLVDHTLHQLYFKAQYAPLPRWVFDASALGERHGRRVLDKLKWVFQITRKELHAKDEIAALARIKTLRNHLQHFDPPAFACSMEEAAGWMNDVLLVAKLVWRIRMLAQALPSTALIALLLKAPMVFAPRDAPKKRLSPAKFVNYSSTSEEALEYGQTHGAIPELPYEHIIIRPSREENLL